MKSINHTLDIIVWPLSAVLIFLALQFISQFVAKTVGFFATEDSALQMAQVAPWTMLVSSVLTSLVLGLTKPFRLFTEFRKWVCDRYNALFSLLIFLIAVFGANILNELLETYCGLEMDSDYKALFEGVVRTPVGVLALVLLGPVCEEIVFRAGIMKPMIDRKVKPWIPIAVSSLIFGLVHGNLSQMIYAVFIGFVLGVIYYRTRSLIITSLAHVLNNAATVTLMLTVDNYEEVRLENFLGIGPMVAAFVLALILLGISLRYFWKNTANQPAEKTE